MNHVRREKRGDYHGFVLQAFFWERISLRCGLIYWQFTSTIEYMEMSANGVKAFGFTSLHLRITGPSSFLSARERFRDSERF